MSMTAIARPTADGLQHDVDVNGRHVLVTDEPLSLGGTDIGPAPHELLAATLASCISTMVALYAKRHDWRLDDLSVEVDYDTDATPPALHYPRQPPRRPDRRAGHAPAPRRRHLPRTPRAGGRIRLRRADRRGGRRSPRRLRPRRRRGSAAGARRPGQHQRGLDLAFGDRPVLAQKRRGVCSGATSSKPLRRSKQTAQSAAAHVPTSMGRVLARSRCASSAPPTPLR